MTGAELKSEYLSVKFKTRGAELCSVKNKNGTEFIWQANPDVWPRHAPVLFPIVGKLINNKYEYNNKTYELGQHGFARDLDFELIEKTDTLCCFELKTTHLTLSKYPFDFSLRIIYELRENVLITTYHINNPSENILPFSIGEHPGFMCLLLPGENFEDYYLEF